MNLLSHPLSNFTWFKIVETASKASKLGSIWTETLKLDFPHFAIYERKGFLHIATGNEKWLHYDSPTKRKSWETTRGRVLTSTANPNIHGTNSYCTVGGIKLVYYELLQSNETGAFYWTQWVRFSRTLKKNTPSTTTDMTKWFSCMITLIHMLRRRGKPNWELQLPLDVFTSTEEHSTHIKLYNN